MRVGVVNDQRTDTDVTNSTIGYLMENGVPDKNIPARPHLGPGVEAAARSSAHALGVAAVASSLGDSGGLTEALQEFGRDAVESVTSIIDGGELAPLSPRTIQARVRRGNSSAKPLEDTGQYHDSIGYEITGE